jgi:hypothetical protein
MLRSGAQRVTGGVLGKALQAEGVFSALQKSGQQSMVRSIFL